MKIAILGTGVVGRSHAEKLTSLNHEVILGTHNVEETLAHRETDGMGEVPFKDWLEKNASVKIVTFSEAADFGGIIFDALKGEVAEDILSKIPPESLDGKILVDIANPLDFSKGMPPTLLFCNTDSLGERLQKALPGMKVVKIFNTVNAHLQTHPEELSGADHTLFISGNDAGAKNEVKKIAQSYGWKDVLDLGDISSARGMEMILPIWLRLWNTLGTAKFNYKIVR